MNEQYRLELERLKRECASLKHKQSALEQTLGSFSRQLTLFEHSLTRATNAVEAGERAPTLETPPIIAQAATADFTGAPEPSALRPPPSTDEAKHLETVCQRCGGRLAFPAHSLGESIACPHCGEMTLLTLEAQAEPALPGPAERPPESIAVSPPLAADLPPAYAPEPDLVSAQAAPAETGDRGSFEMRLGTYWLVRVGIVMVLTALVFFGNYAYQNFIVKLGAGGKVAMLYVASAVLLGAGAWWQRKATKESLRNYAQVLFAGGLAGVYFTTYAAHHFEHLRVIQSAVLDGLLLLGWAGFIVWIADRRKSEVLALFAVGLAYYSSVMTRVGTFTLYSNILLAVAAVVFLVRNRWAALSYASLAATYASYVFWRFFDGRGWHWATPEQGLWLGAYFLFSYWIIFTVAVFLSRHEKLMDENRATFLTFNNGALFSLFLLTMLQVREGGFWKFCLGYGITLIALSELARRFLSSEPLAKNSYLTQGLLLTTLGLVLKFTGMQLSLILAAESVILLILGRRRSSVILTGGAYIAAAMAVGWGIDGMHRYDPQHLYLGCGLGAFMLLNTVLTHQWSSNQSTRVRVDVSFFTVLALIAFLVATWNNCDRQTFPLIIAAEAVVLTVSIYFLRIPEVTLFSQGFLLLAHLTWLLPMLDNRGVPEWWNPALMIVMTLALSHWWQTQKRLQLASEIGMIWQGCYALAVTGVLYFWLGNKLQLPTWLALSSLLALSLTAYGVLTRAWFVAACGQLFLLISGAQFVWQLAQGKPAWHLALAPVAVLLVLSLATVFWFERKPGANERVRAPLLQLAFAYRWIALVMSIWWVCEYIPAPERTWVFSLLGAGIFAWAGWRAKTEGLLFGACYSLTGLALIWIPQPEVRTVYWPNLAAILLWLVQQRVAKNLPERYKLDLPTHATMIGIGGLALWMYVSAWVQQNASGFYLTASWSALALVLFTIGIVLRERMYRWLGLSVLACALGRVLIFDVWKLETLFRVLSFMALGIVLLVLGFVYNKYQERIRQWL